MYGVPYMKLDKSGGLTQCESAVESVRGKPQHSVAMCLRHGENKIGI